MLFSVALVLIVVCCVPAWASIDAADQLSAKNGEIVALKSQVTALESIVYPFMDEIKTIRKQLGKYFPMLLRERRLLV